MPTSDQLSERELRVLEAVVQTYIETAEPAGSQTIARRFGLGVSPATIRNTMSELEEKGYLFHPHTSAGRVPTDRAYRLYVDGLIRLAPPSAEETNTLRQQVLGSGSTLEEILRRAAQVLGVLTQAQIRQGLVERLRGADDAAGSRELLNIFIAERDDIFDLSGESTSVMLGSAQMLAGQPEFSSNLGSRGLLELAERRDLLRRALEARRQ